MGDIKLLDDLTINKIAAGEVIERPSSVVKELIENSLDAGAMHIHVKIENGGKDLIQVIDDGKGMDKDDAVLALERHATSKIRNDQDLLNLQTLGFRGEALPSIAAVSRLELKTCTRGAGEGVIVQAVGGNIISVTPAGLPQGTAVTVNDLYFNTPARLKFMKSIPTETGHIKDTVSCLALANPDVAFQLRHHDMEVLFAPGDGDPLHAVGAVFGNGIIKNLIPLSGEWGAMQIAGYIGRPEIARSNRNNQIIILNGRWIRSRTVSAAVEKAFHTYLPIARFPFFFIEIKLAPEFVDVNVHPAKTEVRFKDENEVFRGIFHLTREALTQGMTKQTGVISVPARKFPTPPPADTVKYPMPSVAKPESNLFVREEAAPTVEWIKPTVTPPVEAEKPFSPQVRGGQAENGRREPVLLYDRTYIIMTDGDGLCLTDQHAAHERVLFERLMKGFEENSGQGQLLLEPVVVEVTPEQKEALTNETMAILNRIGFAVEWFGPEMLIIRGIPTAVPNTDAPDLFQQILADLARGGTGKEQPILDKIIATIACRHAVKAGDILSEQEIHGLLKDLAACTKPYTCPHGRPTQVKISREEIKRLFWRS